MREQAEERLNTLRDEFKAGQEIQADLENRLASVRNTLVRISGAIQVLEELVKEDKSRAVSSSEVPVETVRVAGAR
jgi:chromosome segregation ATPase